MNPNANQWNPYDTSNQNQQQQSSGSYNPYSGVNANNNQQQQEYYDYSGETSDGMYYNDFDPSGHYSYGVGDETNPMGYGLVGPPEEPAEAAATAATAAVTSPGLFYPLAQPYVCHSAPISAVAIDPIVNAVYVAGHTITLNKKRRHATYSTPAAAAGGGSSGKIGGMMSSRNNGVGGGGGGNNSGSIDQRVSMIATHSYPDGSLYSSVAGHVEGRQEVLLDIASALYGGTSTSASASATGMSTRKTHHHPPQQQQKVPKHAYKPPYNRPMNEAQKAALYMNSYQNTDYQIGINKILPFSSQVVVVESNDTIGATTKSEGYICSVSPSAVRMHSQGGLLLSENKTEGLITGTFHPNAYHGGYDDISVASNATHITVGGLSVKTYTSHGISGMNSPNLYCMDLYSNSLKTVASHVVRSANGNDDCCISDLTTSHETGNIVAGVSDGTLRIFDGSWRGSSCVECARVKAHGGGVAQVAVRGNLICTTGFSSRSSTTSTYGSTSDSLYAFPDEHVLVFDIRYLGRGGMAHPFSGLNGGPRFVSFLPPSALSQQDPSSSDCRILIGSGQIDGGLQVITPFKGLMGSEAAQDEMTNFVKPPLSPEWETMTAMQVMGKDLIIGTSLGNILQYRMKENDKTKHIGGSAGKDLVYGDTNSEADNLNNTHDVDNNADVQKLDLELPSYEAEPPELTIDPMVLTEDNAYNSEVPHSIFNSYILQHEPGVSSVCNDMGKPNPYSFGFLTDSVVKQVCKKKLSRNLLGLVAEEKNSNDFLITIPTSKLDFDLGMKSESYFPNTNKLLHDGHLSKVCYDTEADPRKRDRHVERKVGDDMQLPPRYAAKTRPLNSRFSAFDFAALNDTLYPGWDYNGPNSYVSPVILLLYFVPEIHSIMLRSQLKNFDAILSGKRSGKGIDELGTELGFLFHLINNLASHAMVYPKPPGEIEDRCRPVLGAFVPSNFLSTFVTMPEASALALLDGHPAATEVERRPEAFYRFLLHHLDKELDSSVSKKQGSRRPSRNQSTSNKKNLIDSMYGMNAVSMNEFVNEGAGSQSTVTVTRSNTVDMAYEAFLNKDNEVTKPPEFGELLRFSLCKEVPLRAWCNSTKSFETVIQRKIVTSLPTILSLSCSCAGINGEERLPIWRKTENDYDHWLPEFIEIEIEDDGNIITRQLRGAKWEEFQSDGDDSKWEEFRGDDLSKKVSEKLKNATSTLDSGKRIARYSLQAILTFVNTDTVDATNNNDGERGHHVVHVRVPGSHRKHVLSRQLEVTKEHLSSMSKDSQKHLTLIRNVTEEDLKKRIDTIKQQLKELEGDQNEDEWVLFNGPSVSSTVLEDALAFHVPFKEPCILTYRQVDSIKTFEKPVPSKVEIDTSVMYSPIISGSDALSDIVAFDAEFVQVQHEDAILTATGSKMILREGRNALGRMSLIDCRTGKTIVDDHVSPREPVVDYLTRFSGIKPTDLNPKTSSHYLITSKHAYLKIRYLVERGCIFVGHGLNQDFLTVNIFVPPSQIIDTTDIYHLERRRLISLRFLVNYLLGRDMQQDVHDSIEDSIAACELYIKALELKKEGRFESVLHEIYECGQKIDWKVGELHRLRDQQR